MLGDAINMAVGGIAQSIKDAARQSKELKEFEEKYEEELNNGILPQNMNESNIDYWIRRSAFNNVVNTHTKLNQGFQKKAILSALYVAFYDKSVSKELEAIKAQKGFVPPKVLEALVTMVRNRMIDTVKPYRITADDIGKNDDGLDYLIQPVHFVEANKGTTWDWTGTNRDTTHFHVSDYDKLIAEADKTLEVIKEAAKKMEQKAEAGQKIDADDFVDMFPKQN